MVSSPSVRRNWLPLGAMALLFAVFLWGLHYKLSLYHHGQQSRSSFPPAKLLSDAENPSSLRAVVSCLLKSQLKVAPAPAIASVFRTDPFRSEHDALLGPDPVPTPLRAFGQFLPRSPPAA